MRGPRKPADFPEWLHALRGYDDIAAQLPDIDQEPRTPEAGKALELHFVVPPDVLDHAHPLVLLGSMAYVASRIDEGISRLARECRSQGASWTQIGEVLGITKQSAWARYSGED